MRLRFLSLTGTCGGQPLSLFFPSFSSSSFGRKLEFSASDQLRTRIPPPRESRLSFFSSLFVFRVVTSLFFLGASGQGVDFETGFFSPGTRRRLPFFFFFLCTQRLVRFPVGCVRENRTFFFSFRRRDRGGLYFFFFSSFLGRA